MFDKDGLDLREHAIDRVGSVELWVIPFAESRTHEIVLKPTEVPSGARLRAEWSAIVGPELARVSRPEALLALRGRSGKALRLRVPGASALEVQHKSGQIVERVNGYFGHRMIDQIRLVQGAIPAAPAAAPIPAPDPEILAETARRTESVKDPDLRTALTRLGARLASRRHLLMGMLGGRGR